MLGPADAVLFIGCTPPPVAYFSWGQCLSRPLPLLPRGSQHACMPKNARGMTLPWAHPRLLADTYINTRLTDEYPFFPGGPALSTALSTCLPAPLLLTPALSLSLPLPICLLLPLLPRPGTLGDGKKA